MKQTYIRCPRCELNYIQKQDKFCNVCKMEMKALGTMGAEELMDMELCPVCKVNYISPDEDMCAACQKECEYDENGDIVEKAQSNKWGYDEEENDDDGYDDEENGDMVSISDLGDEDDDMTFDDEDDEDLDDSFDDDDEDGDDSDDDDDYDDSDDEDSDDEDDEE